MRNLLSFSIWIFVSFSIFGCQINYKSNEAKQEQQIRPQFGIGDKAIDNLIGNKKDKEKKSSS